MFYFKPTRKYPKRFLGCYWGPWQHGSGEREVKGLLIIYGRHRALFFRMPIKLFFLGT